MEQRTLRLLLIALVLTIGIGAAVTALASGSTPEAKPARNTVYDVAFHDTIVSASTTELRLGDHFILSDAVLLNGENVGHNGGVCTVTDLTGELICSITWSLPDGTISTQLLNTATPEKPFAITGGTGEYAGARGTGLLIEHGDGSDASGGTGTVEFTLID